MAVEPITRSWRGRRRKTTIKSSGPFSDIRYLFVTDHKQIPNERYAVALLVPSPAKWYLTITVAPNLRRDLTRSSHYRAG